jgi:non-ribosomal peptide synthase protein (TIGR01720 family)
MVPAVFLPLAAVPLTATGKTDRRRLRDRAAVLSPSQLEAYRGAATAKRAPATAAERTLQRLWARVLHLPADAIGADDSFFRLGGDSITAMQLSASLRAEGYALGVPDIFQSKTISRLATNLDLRHNTAPDIDEEIDHPFELSPIQRLFFALASDGPNYFNQSFLVPVAQRITPVDLGKAIPAIVRLHSMLRARFSTTADSRWTQSVCPQVDSSYRYQHWTVPSLDGARGIMLASQQGLDIQSGPLFRVDLIDVGESDQYIFLVAHHLVIDLVSWRIILGDLEELLQSGQVSGTKSLPFQRWCQLQAEYGRDVLSPEMAMPCKIPAAPRGYWGEVHHLNTIHNAVHHGFAIGEDVTTTLFGPANDALQTQPVEIFQAALWHSFTRTFPDRAAPVIFNEGHGREPWDAAIDLSRTVGWFTTMWPTCVEMDGTGGDIIDAVRRVKDARRRTPSNGWAYFASRFFNAEGQKAFAIDGPVEVAFNYLGLYQQLERADALLRPPIRLDHHVPDVAGDIARFALVDVIAAVEQGQLRFLFVYNRHMRHQDALARWVTNCERSLLDAAERLAGMARQYTLSDFPLLPLTYANLDTLQNHTLAPIRRAGREVEDVFPCSPMQRGILLSQVRDPRHYQTRFVWKVVPAEASTPVDLDRLRRAWQYVVDRHAILRTVFVESVTDDGYYDQAVLSAAPANVDIVEDVDDDPVAALDRYAEREDRDGQPPHRLVLCTTPTETFCVLDMSHSLIDAHSSRIVQRDLRLAYDGQLPAGLAPTYRDYIAHLQRRPSGAAEAYWRAYLQGVQPCLFPALGSDENNGRKQLRSTTVSFEAGSRLHGFCQRHEVTLSNLFQVAWGLVLRSYTGSDSVCFGYLNSGRDAALLVIQEVVGPLINMLVCRVGVDPETTVLSMLQANHREYLQGLPHQHYSLAEMLHVAQTGGQPLFNTTISVQRPRSGAEEVQTKVELQAVGGYDPTEVSCGSMPCRAFAVEQAADIDYCSTILPLRWECVMMG